MSTNPMRHYMNAVTVKNAPVLDEGIIDSIKKWITGLSNPVRARGQEMVKDLESRLRNKNASKVSQQIQKSNKAWMWSKLTYSDLYRYVLSSDFTEEDLDRALKNPIVNNNMKQIIRALPGDVGKPILPLKSANIKNNTNFISSTVDKQTREYLSKAIAAAVLDGLAYIEQGKKDSAEKPETRPTEPAAEPAPSPSAEATPSVTPNSSEDIKATIAAIRDGLARIKGAA